MGILHYTRKQVVMEQKRLEIPASPFVVIHRDCGHWLIVSVHWGEIDPGEWQEYIYVKIDGEMQFRATCPHCYRPLRVRDLYRPSARQQATQLATRVQVLEGSAA